MKELLIFLISLWFIYELIAHAVKKLNNISISEAHDIVNKKIVDFFSSSTDAHPQILFLSDWEWKELEAGLKHYYYNVCFNGYIDNQDGTISVHFSTAGIITHYVNNVDILKRAITMDIEQFLVSKLGYEVPLYIRTCNDACLIFILAYNTSGFQKVQNCITSSTNLSSLNPKTNAPEIHFTVSQDPHLLYLGIIYQDWYEKSLKILVTIDLRTHPHLLLYGSSGSGKSYALRYYVAQLFLKRQHYELWVADFKNSKDFCSLASKQDVHYASGDNVYNMILDYYEKFDTVRRGEIQVNRHQILILDEYPALVQALAIEDKKKAEHIKLLITSLLMLGRELGKEPQINQFPIFITCQRPDASLFSGITGGGRENFMNVVALGNLSSQAKSMLSATPMNLPNTIYHQGEGVCLIAGRSMTEIIVPKIAYPRKKHPPKDMDIN